MAEILENGNFRGIGNSIGYQLGTFRVVVWNTEEVPITHGDTILALHCALDQATRDMREDQSE